MLLLKLSSSSISTSHCISYNPTMTFNYTFTTLEVKLNSNSSHSSSLLEFSNLNNFPYILVPILTKITDVENGHLLSNHIHSLLLLAQFFSLPLPLKSFLFTQSQVLMIHSHLADWSPPATLFVSISIYCCNYGPVVLGAAC